MLIGYVRVSTNDQNTDLQRSALNCAGCERIGRLLEAGESRQRIALIFDVGVSTIYRKFPANKSNESP